MRAGLAVAAGAAVALLLLLLRAGPACASPSPDSEAVDIGGTAYTRASTTIINRSFLSRDRTLLTDVFLPNTEGLDDAPIVVYGHGFDSSPAENAALLGSLAAAGFKVYAPHSPGEGFNFRDRARDIEAVLRNVTAGLDDPHAYLLGYSLGAVSVLKAADNIGVTAGLSIDGVLAFAPPGGLLNFLSFQRMGDIDITIIAGSNDRTTPYERIELLVEEPWGNVATMYNAHFFVVPGATHSGWMTLPEGRATEEFDREICYKTETEEHCDGFEFLVEHLDNESQLAIELEIALRVMRPPGEAAELIDGAVGGGSLLSCAPPAGDGAPPPANDCRGFCLGGPERDARGDAPGVRQFEGHDAWSPEMRCMTRCC